jgi:vacuolar-type H+-ATPase subunit E/Vma4
MALSDLLQAIEDDASAELDETRRRTQQQAHEILRHGQERADAHRGQALAEAERAAQHAAAAVVAAAAAAARGRYRQARERALQAVHDAVLAEVTASRTRTGHAARTEWLLADGVAHVGTVARLRSHPDDVALVRGLLAARGLAGVPVDGDLATGCGVEVIGPGRRVDNTAETRLASTWSALRSALAVRWERELDEPVDRPVDRSAGQVAP